LQLVDADSVENMTDTRNPVITPVACALPNRPEGAPKMHGGDAVEAVEGTRLREIVGNGKFVAEYFCNYGVNGEYEDRFAAAGMKVSARGAEGEIRAMELEGKRFYVGTLFQPQLSSRENEPHAIVTEFLRACLQFQDERTRTAARVAKRNDVTKSTP
jgi:CTP synthase (UTP-ammonia lyase)